MGLGSSFAVLVVAEMIGVKAGLGWYLQWAQGWAAYANMYAALIVMSLLCSGAITLLFRDARPLAGLAERCRQMVAQAAAEAVARSRGRRRARHRACQPCLRYRWRRAAGAGRRQSSHRARRIRRAAGTLRLRQVDLAAAGRGAGASPSRRLREDDIASRGRIPRAWSCFRTRRLFPWRSVWDNVALGLEAQGILKSQRQRVDDGARSRRPVGVPQRLSASAIGRHGAARGAGARARQRSKNPHPRRAARQARIR